MLKVKLRLLTVVLLQSSLMAQVARQPDNIQYNVISDSIGIRVAPFHFSTDKKERHDWTGKWIWLNKEVYPRYQKTSTLWLPDTSGSHTNYQAHFRKSFHLNSLPAYSILYISGDVLFKVFVNGKPVGRGPVNIGSDYADNRRPPYWYYAAFDVRPFLQKGINIIAAEVFANAFEISATTSSFGRFICDLELDKRQLKLSTDNTWKCNLDTSYNVKKKPMVYDARKEISGWRNLNFDDSSWPVASVQGKADPASFFKSEIPVPMSASLKPASYMEVGDNSETQNIDSSKFYKLQKGKKEFIIDFGKNIPAYIAFEALAAKGDSILVFPFEKLNSRSNRSYKYICSQGKNSYETPNLAVFRYLRIKLYSTSGIDFKLIHANFSTYPVQYIGQFLCSEPFYNKLWNISRWSTQICMNDMLYDSPLHQEPIGCTGDYFIESLNNYYAFGDSWLIRQNLIQTARMLEKNNFKMFHTSYSLLWIQMLLKYYQYTGDDKLVIMLLPQVNELLKRFATYQDKDHILSNAPNYMFMDWVRIGEFNAHHPPAVIGMGYITMMYYKALTDAAELNKLSANQTIVKEFASVAREVKNGINERLWVKNKGLYKDGVPFISKVKPGRWLPADKDIVTFSPHVNTLAVLYDIAPSNKQNDLMEYVVNQKEYQLQPYFMSYILAAFNHTAEIDGGLQQVDKWKNAIDTNTHTLKENWNDKTEDGYNGDYSHAWGGSPLLFLSQNILGISPAKPGYSIIVIKPYAGQKIKWSKGIVPVGNNKTVTVNWKFENKRSYLYQVKIPANHQAILISPKEFQSWSFMINGKKTKYSTEPMALKSGAYNIKYYLN